MTETLAFDTLNYCLYQYSIERFAALPADARFAHYTSAETAMRIIQDKPEDRSLWLRNATEMNDFLEIEFGQQILRSLLSDEATRDKFMGAVNGIHADILPNVTKALDEEFKRIKHSTYLLSLAQHDIQEQNNGLLSMWRAYGGDANVCLVLKPGPFVTPQTAYDVTLSPVMYDGILGFQRELNRMSDRLIERRDVLQTIDQNIVAANLKQAIDFAVLSTKHPGFAEEKEWRVIYRPSDIPNGQELPGKIVSVKGIVQKVHYLPMGNRPDKGLVGAEMGEVLDKLIVGPTPNPELVVRAFVELLENSGVPDAGRKVWYSGVPLRR